jgi:predicted nucleic acid-binding protein
MILVDTSVWIDHFRAADAQLQSLLLSQRVLTHPFVIGELALGGLKRRAAIIHDLQNLPAAAIATPDEVLLFIERQKLASSGVGYVDTALLAATTLTPGATFWTRDKTLRSITQRCGLAPQPPIS